MPREQACEKGGSAPLLLRFAFFFAFLAFLLVLGRHFDFSRSLTVLVSWRPPPGPTLSLRKPPSRRANVLRVVEGTRSAHARDVTAARGGAESAPRLWAGGRASAPGRRARGECARASAALPGLRPGTREGRERSSWCGGRGVLASGERLLRLTPQGA